MNKVYLRDLGLLPDAGCDCTDKFTEIFAAHSSDTEFVFDKGRYDFYASKAIAASYALSNSEHVPTRKLSMLLKHMQNIIFDGNGALFSFHGHLQPISLDQCDNVVLKNFTIDWDKPLVAEGTIVNRGEDFADVKIDTRLFPCEMKDDWLYFDIGDGEWSTLTRWSHIEYGSQHLSLKVPYDTGDYFSPKSIEQVTDDTFRIFTHGKIAAHRAAVGNHFVLRHNARLHAGLFAEKSNNISFENITVHSCGGLGCLTQFCENVHFDTVDFIPNTAVGRIISSGRDDGMQISNCRGEVVIENCTFRGLMDDPINVHGTSVCIVAAAGENSVVCRYMHGEALGFKWWAESGHTIAFLNRQSMNSVFEAEAKSYEILSESDFKLTFNQAIPSEIINILNAEKGSSVYAVENLSNTPSFTCRGNTFGSCRARGVLISTPKKVVIEDNVFDSSGCAILVAGDANGWFESGACRDVTIRRNVFTDSCLSSMYQFCGGVISICPVVPAPDDDRPFHSNITIENNIFYSPDTPVLYAFSTENLKFRNNRIHHSSATPKWHPATTLYKVEHSKNVILQDNKKTGKFTLGDV